MVLDRLRVDAVLQHPALVVVRAQTELALLVRVHRAVVHAEAPVGCHVSATLECSLEPHSAHLVLALVNPLGGDLRLPGGPVLHVEALAAQGDAEGGLLLELEQAGLAVAPLVPGQPELLVLLELGLVPRPDGVLELLAGECEVHTVREPDRAQMLVDLFLIAGVQGPVLPLHRFYELAVGAVAEKLEDFREQGLVLVGIALEPVVRHLGHEPAEDFARFVVDGAIYRGDL